MVEPNARIVHRPFLLDENELDDDFLLDVDSDDEVDAGSDNELDETAADLYLESNDPGVGERRRRSRSKS